MGEGGTDALVLERVLALDVGVQQFVAELIHAEEDRTRFRAGQRADAIRVFQTLPVLNRNREDQIQLTRQQGRDAGRILRRSAS